jgi:hypothetical protein
MSAKSVWPHVAFRLGMTVLRASPYPRTTPNQNRSSCNTVS